MQKILSLLRRCVIILMFLMRSIVPKSIHLNFYKMC